MREAVVILKKDIKIQSKYRIIWANRIITPFFIIAPWVFTGNIFSHNFGVSIIVGGILWYWLNQLFFGVQDAFVDEREEGTLESVVLSPISLRIFIIGKSLWVIVECVYITFFTVLFFYLLGFESITLLVGIFIYILLGISLFSFSYLWAPLVLIFRKLHGTSFIVQEGIGSISGVTANVKSYPSYIRVFSNILPLTFAIMFARAYLYGDIQTMEFSALALFMISVIYLILGDILLKYAEKINRIEGGWEKW